MAGARRGGRAWATWLVLAVACTSPVTVPGDEGGGDMTGQDLGDDVPVAFDPAAGDTPVDRPPGHAALRFQVDDRANRTYGDKQMKWTGSFSWNAADNTIAYASAWMPENGPFPWLYDDGPAAAGGHEPAGAVKDDHVFEVEVFVKADEDLTFEYGALNELDRWIWVGPNGTVTVPRGSTDVFEAEGLVLPPFGDVDLKLTLDLAALDAEFAGIDPEETDIYLKSSANSWTPTQLLDDGDGATGDDTAGDGVFTFVQSKRLGGHDGLLFEGQHAQFVFVFALRGSDADDGQEYKAGTTVLATGVHAFTDVAARGTFAPATVVWERAARGKEFNTTVIVGGGKPWCAVAADCFGGVECQADGCKVDDEPPPPLSEPGIASVEPATGPAAGGTAVTLRGTDFRAGCTVTFGGAAATGVVVVSAAEVTLATPAHAAGAVDVVLRNPDGGSDTAAGAYTYTGDVPPLSTPRLDLVDPAKGPVAGGTEVTLTGRDFADGCTVAFAGVAATGVAFVSATEVHATTPAHAKGLVDVVLQNPDGGTATYPNAYEFVEPQPPAVADWGRLLAPLSIDAQAGDALPDVHGEVYEPGVTEAGGGDGLVAAQVGWGPAGSDPRQAGAGWSWVAAAYDRAGGDTGNNAVFRGALGPAAAGTYAYTFRFSLDAGATWLVVDSDGTSAAGTDFSAASLGALSLAAVDPEAPVVTSVTPAWSPTSGGGTVTVAGQRLAGTATVSVGGVDAAATASGDGTSLTFTAPGREAGIVSLALTNGAGRSVTKPRAFAFAPKAAAAPVVDGVLGADWNAGWRVAVNGVATDWGTGSNQLDSLWVAYDDTNLYLGVRGTCESANAIVVYLDRDLGAGTGVASLAALTDVTGALDNAVSSLLAVSASGFGADKAVGTKGMASFTCTDPGNLAGGDGAGWRDLANPADLGWDCGQVAATAEGFEARIPLATFLGGALPATGLDLGLVARLVNEDGQSCSNQSLPPIGGSTFTQNTVVEVPLR